MARDHRLQRVEDLRCRIRQGLAALRKETLGSEGWERCLAQLEVLWRDLFALLDELELG